MSKPTITHEELLLLLSYDLATGLFVWREDRRAVRAGDVAGSVNSSGYVYIEIYGKAYRAHRLAWFYAHAAWPVSEIDHINRGRADNRLANLRQASKSQNLANAARHRSNKTGFKGVVARGAKYAAQIKKDGVVRKLGYFATPQEAHAAYVGAAAKLHGEFARAA